MVLSQASEQSLLYDLYTSTSGWGSSCSTGWITNTTPVCTGNSSVWSRVICGSGQVMQIDLSGCGIRGTVSPEWGSMTSMQELALNDNFLTGTLPPQWCNMTNLRSLDMSSNSLDGSLPPEWSNMTTLQIVVLSNNSLAGTIPPQWGHMTNLRSLDINSNFLNGAVPPEWSNMTRLQTVVLNGNSLTGTIPPEWSALSREGSVSRSHAQGSMTTTSSVFGSSTSAAPPRSLTLTIQSDRLSSSSSLSKSATTRTSECAMATASPSLLATLSHTNLVPLPLDSLPMNRLVVAACSGAAFIAGVVELALGPFASVTSAGGDGIAELAAVSQVSCRRGGSGGKDSSSLSRLSLSFFFDLGPLWIVGGNVAVAVGFCVLHAATWSCCSKQDGWQHAVRLCCFRASR